MNWYKKANLWDDIKRYGPKAGGKMYPTTEQIGFDEGELDNLIQFLQDQFSISREEAEKKVKDMPEVYRRDYFASNYGWSVPSENAINEIKEFVGGDTVLSVGSGYGLWSKLFKEVGINAIATTLLPKDSDGHMPKREHFFTEVDDLNHLEALNKYPNANVMFMSWPPYEDAMAFEALQNFKGNKLIYIGERQGGCTGCDNFHYLLYSNWEEVDYVDIPQWIGIHDNVTLWRRK